MKKVNYKVFYSLICQFTNKKISRDFFVIEWRHEQKRHGITQWTWCGKDGGK
jgi:hypothetical protein